MVETLAIHRLAKSLSWEQAFFDSSGRRQIELTNFIVAVRDIEDKLSPLNISSCFFPKDATAEKQIEAILDMVSYHYSSYY